MSEHNYLVIDTLSIDEGDTGITYQDLFCNYLSGMTHVEIREPYLRNHHQFGNLKKFVELLKNQEGNIQVDLITTQSTGHFVRDYTVEQQKESLDSIALYFNNMGIVFNYEFENGGHVRRITADNEKTVKSDRGLHIYREIEAYNGEDDFSQRQCKKTEIDYIKPLELEIASYDTNVDVGEQKKTEKAYIVREDGNDNRSIIIDNITANDVGNKKIRIKAQNKHLFPREIRGQCKSYILPLRYLGVDCDYKYIIGSNDGRSRSGIIRLGSDLYDHIGIEEGTKLSIELKDDGVYEISKIENGEGKNE